jgi:sensor c-di-GMP phosphodiesterase-like protein
LLWVFFPQFGHVFGGHLKRFWQLRSLLAASVIATVILSALIAALLASRSAQRNIENSARRAVLNAERLIDRTSADLQKLDALSGVNCDSEVQAKLKDAVYAAVSQIREIGLIKGETLYCTNFGPTNVNMAPVKDSLKVGTFVSVGPNAVIANNSSLFVYTSRQEGLSLNAVINPIILAEFERGSTLSGRAYLELKYSGTSANGLNADKRDLIYEVGQRDVKINGDDFLEGEFKSTRYPIYAEIRADQGIFWDEYWPTLRQLLIVLFPLLLVVAFILNRLLAGGALYRMRYHQALKRGEFKVYYQPIVSSQTRKLAGMEALLRWEHPKKGLLRAAQFHHLFNDEDMDEPIARFVLETVINDLKSAPISTTHLWCSMNVAPALLERPLFATEFTQLAKQLPANQLRIEITERTPVSPAAEVTIREFRGHGIRVGLDDFGTGYSNISQLQTLAYDFIKVDGLLIRGIQTTDGLSPVLDSVIQMADRLGVDIVAEGVETLVQAQALTTRNVKSLQGYLFSQARPFSEIVASVGDEHAFELGAIL